MPLLITIIFYPDFALNKHFLGISLQQMASLGQFKATQVQALIELLQLYLSIMQRYHRHQGRQLVSQE